MVINEAPGVPATHEKCRASTLLGIPAQNTAGAKLVAVFVLLFFIVLLYA